MNAILDIKNVTAATLSFKDERLVEATQRIATIYASAAEFAEAKNREIAKILADVMEQKSYVKDGFKSVSDYAGKTFGINKNNAYALANAGKVYNDPKANPKLKELSPSKLVELVNVDSGTVDKALENGTITAASTQKQLREFATNAQSASKALKGEVVRMYTAYLCISDIPSTVDYTELVNPRTLEEWDSYITSPDFMAAMMHDDEPYPIPVEIVKLSKVKATPDDKKATIERHLYVTDDISLVVKFSPYKPSKPKKDEKPAAAPRFTRDQLLAMLAAMDEVQETGKGGKSDKK